MIRTQSIDTRRYAKCIDASKRVRWEIDRDVIRGRSFSTAGKFLPDALALARVFAFLEEKDREFISRIQGRNYANMLCLFERFIGAKVLDASREHWFGDQVVLEALVRFADEELKHQALFRRLDAMMAETMPAGYAFVPDPNAVAAAVLGRSSWAVLALICLIELVSLAHFRQSIEPADMLDPLWKDVFLFHWKEESQHATLDELEWRRVNARIDDAARERGVGDLISLLGAVDGILQGQALADGRYFATACGRHVDAEEEALVAGGLLKAYRWQYIVSGIEVPHFGAILGEMVSTSQFGRIVAALTPPVAAVAVTPERSPA